MYTTFEEQEKMLKPCPLCGAPARITGWKIGMDREETEVRCTGCGLTLNWTQHFVRSSTKRVNEGPDFRAAWNRRAKQ